MKEKRWKKSLQATEKERERNSEKLPASSLNERQRDSK